MVPFEKEFFIKEIESHLEKLNFSRELKDISVKLETFSAPISGYIIMFHQLKEVRCPVLYIRGEKAMSLTPDEVIGCFIPASYARGKVGILGLGLGYLTQKVLQNKNVSQVIVYEKEEEVIELYLSSFGSHHKLKILQGDGFKAKPEAFDFFFSDIYSNKLTEEIALHYEALNRLHSIEEYAFWGMERFLLSCNLEDILSIYIPEVWMAMSKELFSRYNNSAFKDELKLLEGEYIRPLLQKFKEIL